MGANITNSSGSRACAASGAAIAAPAAAHPASAGSWLAPRGARWPWLPEGPTNALASTQMAQAQAAQESSALERWAAIAAVQTRHDGAVGSLDKNG
eukprot:CAMPEP_0179135160 /NCGR_PEP_ID=MMETSP0796-20121207/64343_1 /TAXON_ID=73915 /ORGANISM="Pyrodinium bahamense, Strain pbaha01" /LENGTH=95 /DNA_ID=CAMNT_0020834175 /DNA_START=1 /DNA_END=285 /DNA_ORIENTATION=+